MAVGTRVLSPVSVSRGAWTATTTSSWYTEVADRVTVGQGFYLVITSIPVTASGDATASAVPFVVSATGKYNLYYDQSNYTDRGGSVVSPLEVYSGTVTLGLRTGSSSTKTYSYLERGGFLVVRIR